MADALGVSVQMLINWKKRDKDLTASQIAYALLQARDRGIREAQYHTIKPVVEFFPINPHQLKTTRVVFDPSGSEYQKGLRKALIDAHGIYIFYDSRGRALYVGQARSQSLWKEMNLAYNRCREVQKLIRVHHPNGGKHFIPACEYDRQPKSTQLELYDLARYFSAYNVDDGMINDLEALLVRGFANDLLNVKMERFVHAKSELC